MTDTAHPSPEELVEVVDALAWFSRGQRLDDRDSLALLHLSESKLPHLNEELREQARRLVTDLENELDMEPDEAILVDERILRGVVNRALKVGAAQALYDAGKTAREIRDMINSLLSDNGGVSDLGET